MAKSYRFEPKKIEVDAGSSVTWTNDDNFTHTVQVDGQDDHKVDRGKSVSISVRQARHVPLHLHAAQPGHGRRGDRQVITRAAIERDVVIIACAISAGIHAALTPDHLDGGRRRRRGFAVATVLLAALAVALTRAVSTAALAGAAALLRGLCSSSYALAVTTGLPLLHPEPEAVDGLALVHQGRRGRWACWPQPACSRAGRPAPSLNSPRPKGTLA